MDERVIKFQEKTIWNLRSLYRKYGYLPYKMSKFEEYELYIRNKDFLVSDQVIAFNDTNGKLMALKPDVTLSIIKSGEDCPGVKQKVYYNENVYRICESTHRFKEIMQTGLECIGAVDLYDISEVIVLAAESLATLSPRFCLEISHLTLVRDVLSSLCDDETFLHEAIRCIADKNTDDLQVVCSQYGVDDAGYKTASLFVTVYGDRRQVLQKLSERLDASTLAPLAALDALLSTSPYSDSIRYDFSVVNDMNYYNAFVFKGFIDGICCGVLAGGQYDHLMQKMDRSAKAIGFALYLDRLEDLSQDRPKYDFDVLLLYSEKTEPMQVAQTVASLVAKGQTVSAQKDVPPQVRFAQTVDLRQKS